MDPAWIVAAISLATVISGLVVWLLRSAWRFGRRAWSFIEDWDGVVAEHGHAAKPGVLERLSNLEGVVAGISDQVHLNSGHSMRDVVQRTESAVGDVQQSLNTLTQRVEKLTGGKP
jgi:hypothetical protein